MSGSVGWLEMEQLVEASRLSVFIQPLVNVYSFLIDYCLVDTTTTATSERGDTDI